ncbi:sensor histidine kinase [Clostridium sp. WILCCON 0269]|uniref:histidine kinase n=1 Tax=Candidatus Clostridium eludens TaxID=3381663 RepID=A0ABW8SH84_9CLOT
MIKSKRNIKTRIFFSHIIIIMIYVLITSMVFRVSLNVYIRRQIKKQLISAGELIKRSMSIENFNSKNTEDKRDIQTLLKTERMLKQTKTFLDLNYAVMDKNSNVIFPQKENSRQYNLVNNNIIPIMFKRRIFNLINRSGIRYFRVQGKQYCAVIYPIKSNKSENTSAMLIYANMDKSKNMIFKVNIILFTILIITGLIAIFASNVVAKKFSRPIIELSKYAKKIGERQYHSKPGIYEDEEINQLSETMYEMSQKLSMYDNTMKTFLQNASHELRTPLMSIQGYAEGVKLGVVDDKEAAIDIIIEESKRLTTIVEDLLYLSKIDSMQESINFEDLSVEDLVRSCIERVKGMAVKLDKTIEFFNSGKDILVKGDEEKLSRAIINVLGNCIRYAGKEVIVNFKSEDSKLIINIVDDGPGVDENELKNIFDRFFKGKGGQHGLGLAIAKSIIDKHNGSITAENNTHTGACFKIILPL